MSTQAQTSAQTAHEVHIDAPLHFRMWSPEFPNLRTCNHHLDTGALFSRILREKYAQILFSGRRAYILAKCWSKPVSHFERESQMPRGLLFAKSRERLGSSSRCKTCAHCWRCSFRSSFPTREIPPFVRFQSSMLCAHLRIRKTCPICASHSRQIRLQQKRSRECLSCAPKPGPSDSPN